MQRLQYAAWGPDELIGAGLAIATGSISSGPGLARLAASLGALTKVHGAFPVNAGRTAIWLALLAMRKLQPKRDRVIVPAYVCPGITHAVERAGLVWTIADVRADLNVDPAAVHAALDDRTLAVIVPHMYGCPAQIGEFERMCRDAGAFLIDDAAQIVGIEHEGRVLGGCGDAGIMSFAQSKSIVTGVRGSGGMLLVSNPALDGAVRELHAALPAAAGRFAQFAHFLFHYLTMPRLGQAGRVLGKLVHSISSPPGTRDFFVPARMGNMEAAIAARQLAGLAARCEARVRLAGLFAGELRQMEGVRFPQYSAGRYLTRFMIAAPDGVDVVRLRADLRGAGVASRPGYPALILPGCNSTNAQAWSRRLIELPSRTTMSDDDVRAICAAFGEALHGRTAPAGVRHSSGTTA